MKKSLMLLVLGVLGSQTALAVDPWETGGKIHLGKLGNVQGKTILSKRRYEFGTTNTTDFKPNASVFQFRTENEFRSCTFSLASNVEVPGILENLYLDANVTLTLAGVSFYQGDSRYNSNVSLTMATQSGTSLRLDCAVLPGDRLVTLKDLELLLRPYFDITSLLPKPPTGRQVMDPNWKPEEQYI